MDDVEWDAAMDGAISMAKDQLGKRFGHKNKLKLGRCCESQLHTLIRRFEAEKIGISTEQIRNGRREPTKAEQILIRVEQQEHEERCLAVSVCPTCGDDLSYSYDHRVSKVCKTCNLSWCR